MYSTPIIPVKKIVDFKMKREKKDMFEPLSSASHEIYNAIILLANKRASEKERMNDNEIFTHTHTPMAYRIIGTEFSHI